ncbi:MAG: gliding motility-associated C-terminal domain-containing protein [Bacteroidales bacterium]|jgi:gliding motility-associated-like protein
MVNKNLFSIIFLTFFIFSSLLGQGYRGDVINYCDVDSVLLEASDGYNSYLWNTGETTSSIWAKRSGTFVVKQMSGSTTVLDTFLLDLNNVKVASNDTTVCYGVDYSIKLKNVEPYCLSGNYTCDFGNTEDVSGYNNHGLTGLPLISTEDRFGNEEGAIFLSPSTTNPASLSVIQIPYSENQDIFNSFTLHCWLRPDSIYGTSAMDNTYYIINKWKPAVKDLSECSYALTIDKEGYIGFLTSDGVSSQEFKVTKAKVVDGNWSMVDVVCCLNELKIYINGTLMLSESINVFPQKLEQPTYIGAALGLKNHNYQGGIDDIRIYTCDLSKQEIKNLKDSNSTYNYSYVWNDGSTSENLHINPTETQDFFVDVTSIYNNTCRTGVTISVYPEFNVNITQMKKGCPDTEEGILLVSATGGVPFGDGRLPYDYDYPLGVLFSDSLMYKLPKGTYEVTVTDSVGCYITQKAEVETYPKLGINIICDPAKIYPQNPIISLRTEIECDTSYVYKYFWDFGDGNGSYSVETTHDYGAFDEEVYSEFIIKNIQTYEADCKDSATYTLQIARPNLKIPNVFTPNGDGVNDTFEITLEDDPERTLMEVFLGNSLHIYNRQGKLVYTKIDYAGKPGEFDGGNLPDGVYFYVLECRGSKEDTVYKGFFHIFRNALDNVEQ